MGLLSEIIRALDVVAAANAMGGLILYVPVLFAIKDQTKRTVLEEELGRKARQMVVGVIFLLMAFFAIFTNLVYLYATINADPLSGMSNDLVRVFYVSCAVIGTAAHIATAWGMGLLWPRNFALVLVLDAILFAIVMSLHGMPF
jgi:hypothetical protein